MKTKREELEEILKLYEREQKLRRKYKKMREALELLPDDIHAVQEEYIARVNAFIGELDNNQG